jgi:octopine/nopaline transport system substrate-binding protein
MRNWIVLAAAAVAVVAVLVLLRLPGGMSGPPPDKEVPDPLRIATEGAYPPYNSIDASGHLVGFEIDLAAEICKRMKVECKIVAQNWDGIIPGLDAGKYDAIMAGMSITPERQKAVGFSQPYSTTPAFFVVPKNSPLMQIDFGIEQIDMTEIDEAEQTALNRLRDALKGKQIGVQVATVHGNFLEQYLGDVATIRRYDTQDQMALDLTAGRIDAALADLLAWQPFLDSDGGQNASLVGPGFNGGLFGPGVGIAVRQNAGVLLDALNRALTTMKEDGSLAQLAAQWFGFDASVH